jgi:hypothetical protein
MSSQEVSSSSDGEAVKKEKTEQKKKDDGKGKGKDKKQEQQPKKDKSSNDDKQQNKKKVKEEKREKKETDSSEEAESCDDSSSGEEKEEEKGKEKEEEKEEEKKKDDESEDDDGEGTSAKKEKKKKKKGKKAKEGSGEHERVWEGHKIQGLYHVHDALKRDLRAVLRYIDDLDLSQSENVSALCVYYDFFHAFLHEHHETEETFFFPRMEQKIPETKKFIERMKEQHEQLLTLEQTFVDCLHALQPPQDDPKKKKKKGAKSAPKTKTAHNKKEEMGTKKDKKKDKEKQDDGVESKVESLREAGQAFMETMIAHLDEEEHDLVKLLMEHTTPAWQGQLVKQLGKHMSKQKGGTAGLVYTLVAAGDEHEREFLRDLPLPPRLLYRWRWKKAFFRSAPRLYLQAHGYLQP